ncbi:hypothetical protein C8F04DRAFT_1181460 [Mycena alexandri]|uniref:Uncharacterized protein n=1 Tax=Mycena alexandri TaxID=1745969 RepID=A0AAD6T227_9AGAR|nr:hypothetical protein C8F04DRAFT_1181460 [Mycena alexandri]
MILPDSPLCFAHFFLPLHAYFFSSARVSRGLRRVIPRFSRAILALRRALDALFSPWEGEAITASPGFQISGAVVSALDAEQDEDLTEPDTVDEALVAAVETFTFIEHSDVGSQTTQPPPPAQTSGPRKARDKAGSKARRNAARKAAKVNEHINLLPPARRPKHVTNAAPVKTRFQLMKHRVASTGWIGLRDNGQSEQERAANFEEPGWTPSHHIHDFFGDQHRFKGFQYVKYLGPKTRPLLDAAGRAFAIFAGHPKDPNWKQDVHDPAVEALNEARSKCKVSEVRRHHRRGYFPPLSAGDSNGGGQIQPGALVNGVINTAVLCALMSNIAFIRLAGFATATTRSICGNSTRGILISSGLSSTVYGPPVPSTWALKPVALVTRDFGNLAFGWCAVTALGNYDYTKGGHLILWDCKIILEFPPGCTILLPSAAIFHSNIPISTNECRYSFTQYTAGGIFRWIEHGFQSEEAYFDSLSAEEVGRERAEARERWSRGVGYFSTLEELRAM